MNLEKNEYLHEITFDILLCLNQKWMTHMAETPCILLPGRHVMCLMWHDCVIIANIAIVLI